jgi:hypothetical protein
VERAANGIELGAPHDSIVDAIAGNPLTFLPFRSNPNGIVIKAPHNRRLPATRIPSVPRSFWDGNKRLIPGLVLRTNGNAVAGPNVMRFVEGGIVIANGSGNVVAGNYIGTDPTGAQAMPNGQEKCGGGVLIQSAAAANRIGTDTNGVSDETEQNLISGNDAFGIFIEGSGNIVGGNYIGLHRDDQVALPDLLSGVSINGDNNVIGGTATDAGNVISGNADAGVSIFGSEVTGNVVQGNFIGTNNTGRFGVNLLLAKSSDHRVIPMSVE